MVVFNTRQCNLMCSEEASLCVLCFEIHRYGESTAWYRDNVSWSRGGGVVIAVCR